MFPTEIYTEILIHIDDFKWLYTTCTIVCKSFNKLIKENKLKFLEACKKTVLTRNKDVVMFNEIWGKIITLEWKTVQHILHLEELFSFKHVKNDALTFITYEYKVPAIRYWVSFILYEFLSSKEDIIMQFSSHKYVHFLPVLSCLLPTILETHQSIWFEINADPGCIDSVLTKSLNIMKTECEDGNLPCNQKITQHWAQTESQLLEEYDCLICLDHMTPSQGQQYQLKYKRFFGIVGPRAPLQRNFISRGYEFVREYNCNLDTFGNVLRKYVRNPKKRKNDE